ncbi:hypothetical protein Efla_000216 [Eimeria flavescens]
MERRPRICTICFAELRGLLSVFANCGHKYHKECYHKWIGSNRGPEPACDTCRGPCFQSEAEWVEFAVSRLPPDEKTVDEGANPTLQERVMAAPRPGIGEEEGRRLQGKLHMIKLRLEDDAAKKKTFVQRYAFSLYGIRSAEIRITDDAAKLLNAGWLTPQQPSFLAYLCQSLAEKLANRTQILSGIIGAASGYFVCLLIEWYFCIG